MENVRDQVLKQGADSTDQSYSRAILAYRHTAGALLAVEQELYSTVSGRHRIEDCMYCIVLFSGIYSQSDREVKLKSHSDLYKLN